MHDLSYQHRSTINNPSPNKLPAEVDLFGFAVECGGFHRRGGKQQSYFHTGRGEAIGDAFEDPGVVVQLLRHRRISGGDERAFGVRWRDGDGEKR